MEKIIIENQEQFNELISQGIRDFSCYTYNGAKLCCRDKGISKLPKLPKCKELYCTNNRLVKLPALPKCRVLACENNDIYKLPALPKCEILFYGNNYIEEQPPLPSANLYNEIMFRSFLKRQKHSMYEFYLAAQQILGPRLLLYSILKNNNNFKN
jgi:hypothetical protein